MVRHKISDERMIENVNSLVFAREFFNIVNAQTKNDTVGTTDAISAPRSISVDAIVSAMMCLGITSDSNFIKRVLVQANPAKFPADTHSVSYDDK